MDALKKAEKELNGGDAKTSRHHLQLRRNRLREILAVGSASNQATF